MKQLRQATLLFLTRGDEILLAMKKRGFGEGHWNGVGGKPDPGESIEAAAIRECQEEIEVVPRSIKQVATLNFYFPEDKSDWNQQVIVYFSDQWEGEPTETEEMAPQWFKKSAIPYDSMWSDDIYWLPLTLEGKFVEGEFWFNTDKSLRKHTIDAS